MLLEVKGLKKHFPIKKEGLFSIQDGMHRAVDGVDFTLSVGETLGLVGESGSGKSTLARLILRLMEPTAGEVYFKGVNLYTLPHEAMRRMRRNIQIIFQDPYASLNPRMRVLDIVGEPLAIHEKISRQEKKDRVVAILQQVGIGPEALNRYPHEFSGGQRQRVGIARAIILHPEIVVADEPVSALDVSVQAQVMELLSHLRESLGLAFLFIAHDLAVVESFSDRTAVMYLGKIVELAKSDELYSHPMHPYTQELLSSVPIPDPHHRKKRRQDTRGSAFPPSCNHLPEESPALHEISSGHYLACHLRLAEVNRFTKT